MPPVRFASHAANWLATGMNVGIGRSGSRSVCSRAPRRVLCALNAIALSSVCITSTMIVRRDQPRGSSSFRNVTGWRAAAPTQLERPRHARPVADQHRVERAHRVGRVAVDDGLDVRVGIGIDRAGDRDALLDVRRAGRERDREDRLRVRAHELADAVGDPRQRAVQPARREQLVGAERTGREHHAAGGERPAAAPQPCAGTLGRDLVSLRAVGRAERADVDHLALGEHLGPGLLGEVQVVLDQRVLGAVRAADHAAPAAQARRALRPGTAEERVGQPLARLAVEQDAHARLGVRVLDADLARELAQQVVRRVVLVVGDDAEHPLRLVVVRREHRLPVVQPRPLRILVEAPPRAVERVRVAERPAADAGAADDRDVLEGRHPEDPAHPEPRRPEVPPQVPGRLREVVVGEALAALEHPDAVALLAQPQRRDAAAEARAHDHPVVVHPGTVPAKVTQASGFAVLTPARRGYEGSQTFGRRLLVS